MVRYAVPMCIYFGLLSVRIRRKNSQARENRSEMHIEQKENRTQNKWTSRTKRDNKSQAKRSIKSERIIKKKKKANSHSKADTNNKHIYVKIGWRTRG